MHFGTLKICVFIEKGIVFRVKVTDFFNVENTDGLHKFPVSGGTGAGCHHSGPLCRGYWSRFLS